jgi:uncharacterized phage-associated protein
MVTPLAVANYFIVKSLNTGEEMTPMKLVKLVYISHGWHLGLTEEPLLAEAVQAWKYGPVVTSVYHEFEHYGNSAITSLAYDGAAYPTVTDETKKAFLDKIWEVYGKFNGLQLSTLTHQSDTPWDIVWNKQSGKKKKTAIIPNDLIKEHYKLKANARAKELA